MTLATQYREREDAPHWVYFVYGDEGRLLYIGCTAHPTRRRMAHMSRSKWWSLMRRVHLRGPYPSRSRARTAERRAIFGLQPEFNHQWTGPRVEGFVA